MIYFRSVYGADVGLGLDKSIEKYDLVVTIQGRLHGGI
jgi:hypothetical protein